MSKRDDDSQADMEVGMTTAERRRRRRRGAGLRVPSDNVPRRSSTPPVAPVPEDPALAMSIAYSFAGEPSEPITSRTPTRESVPSFENHESMPTVIDPVSGPIEQADFEMKTREMPAVDLEELGLSEPGAPFHTLPLRRLSATELDSGPTAMPTAIPGVGGAAARREPTDPADDVEVDLDASVDGMDDGIVDEDALDDEDSLDGEVDAGVTLDGERNRVLATQLDDGDDGDDATTIHPGPPVPTAELAARETSQPRPAIADGPPRPPPSESSPPPTPRIPPPPSTPPAIAAPASSAAPPSLSSIPIAAVTPMAAGDAFPRPVATESSAPRQIAGESRSGPMPIPPVAPPSGFRIGRAQTVALSEDDLEEVREAARMSTQAQAQAHPHPPSQLSIPTIAPPRPMSTSIPPPMPPARLTKPRMPVSVPEIDLHALEERATEPQTEFEVDVDGIVDTKPAEPADDARTTEPRPAEARPAEATAPSAALASPAASLSSLGPPGSPLASLGPVSSLALLGSTGPLGTPSGSLASIAPSGSQVPPAPGAGPVEPRTRSLSPPPISARDSQPMGALREPAHAAPPPPPPASSPRDSQPMGALRDGVHAPPPPPPAPHKAPAAPPSPPPAPAAKKAPPAAAAVAPVAKQELRDSRDAVAKGEGRADGKPPRGKPWFIDLFDEDYLRTLPFLTPQATQAEAEFVIDAMGLTPGAQVLDVGCGYGRHAMELAARGFHIVGLDLSTPLLVRGGEEAHRRGLTINFVRGDMRELDFEAQFDGAYCLFSTFGYFDDETNKKTVANIARALRPGGRMLIEILNRDYVIADLPTRVWWEGDGCVVLEEVELNYFSSRIQVNRSVVFDDGRQVEQEISVRAYSLHEVGKLMHSAGLRVLEVSGAYHTRGRFFGNQSRHIIVLAERKDPSAS